MKKQFLRSLLALLLVVTMLPGSALMGLAAEAGTVGEVQSGEAQSVEGGAVTGEPGTEANRITEVTKEEEKEKPQMTLAEVDMIPEGVTIGEFEVGDMTGAEAYELVAEYLQEMADHTVTMQLGRDEIEVTLEELHLYWENEGEVATMLDNVSHGNLLAQYKAVKDIEQGEADTEIRFGLEETAAEVLDEILLPLNVEPQNATLERGADGNWIINEEVDGIVANSAEAVRVINEALSGWESGDLTVEVPAEVTYAQYTTEIYEGISTKPIASFSTDYLHPTDGNRNHNVQFASSKLNGRIFMPDEEISFNSLISPVKENPEEPLNGYLTGTSYANGVLTKSIGGGICQVATTFYNVCLLLELDILNRQAHSMSIAYVDPGLDATIHPQTGLDLKVRNSTGHALYLESYVSGKDLVINFYGVDDRPEYREVVYRSEILLLEDIVEQDLEDLTLKPGVVVYEQYGHSRCVAQSYKDVYEHGKLVESIPLNRDSYKPLDTIRRYGPAIDDEGNHYYINDLGYAVGEDGTKYRLNEDGTFLDLPPANQKETDESTDGDSESTDSPVSGTVESSKPESSTQEPTSTQNPSGVSE